MTFALEVVLDPHDACSHDVGALLRIERGPISVGGLGCDVYVGGPAGAVLTVRDEGAHAIVERDGSAQAVGADAPVRVDDVLFRVVADVGPPLTHVDEAGRWLVYDTLQATVPGRYWALRRRDGALEHACLVLTERGVQTTLDDAPLDRFHHGDLTGYVFPRARGVNLMAFLGRAGASLDPLMGAHLAARLCTTPWLVDIDVGWDGSVRSRPRCTGVTLDVDEVTRLVRLVRTLLPDAAQRALHSQGFTVPAVLAGALDYDTFEAVILGREVEDALWLLSRSLPPLTNEQVANAVRGLFPDEWRAEQELQEQLAMLDDDAFARLRAHGGARPG